MVKKSKLQDYFQLVTVYRTGNEIRVTYMTNKTNFPKLYNHPSVDFYFLMLNMIHQPYLVKGSVRMQWHRSGLIASWEFFDEHAARKKGSEDSIPNEPTLEKQNVRKWGAMVVIKSLQFLPTVLTAALREATHNSPNAISNESNQTATCCNMMHIALAGVNHPMSLLQDR